MIWNFCIRRPVLTIVIFLVVAIFGFYGYLQLPVRENPDIDFPIVSVNVVLPGAEPEVIETEIIEPLEEQLNTIEGLKELRSTAREQVGNVTAEFELWRDIDIAAQDVRDRVDRSRRELPNGIEAPIVRKLDPDASPVMWIALTGNERWDTIRITNYADEVLKERLENIRGVGQILVGGERKYAVRLRLDADKLAAHGVTVQDVVTTVQQNNVDIPSGRVESREREFLVKTQGQFSEPGPINDLIITDRDGSPVRIRDVGEAVDGVENDRQIARFTTEPAVGLGVVKQSDANTVQLTSAVHERIAELSKDFPPGLKYTISTDDSVYIKDTINDLIMTIFIAAGLVVLVVLSFLRSISGTFITSLAIPTSLLGGIAVVYAMGFSLNVMTMLALILTIGIVIDDAIVILENCYRKLEEGAEPQAAAQVGTTEVAFAAIANSLSLSAVFIPVAFTQGLIGRFFFEFGLTVAATVFASTFTALTLTPMLCSRLLRLPKREGVLRRLSKSADNVLDRVYAIVLAGAFKARWAVVLAALLIVAASSWFYFELESEFAPNIDRSEFMVAFETPEGATVRATDAFSRQIEQEFLKVPEVDRFFLAIALSRGSGPGQVNQGLSFVRLVQRNERGRHQTEVAQEVRERLSKLPYGRAFVIENTGGGPGSGEAPLQVVLQGADLDTIARAKDNVVAWMRQQPEFVGVNSDLKMNKPQANITINRDKAAQMGISIADISNTLRFLLGEPDISEIERDNERYEVIPEVVGKGFMIPRDIGDLYIRNSQQEAVALSNLVEVAEGIGPSEIHHFNRLRSATVSASTPPDVTLGDAVEKLENYLDENLPAGMEHTLAGQAQDFEESFFYLTIAMIFAIVFVYLVLAAQFESFIHPFTILLSLPLASIGAFGALWALDMTFNIFSFIGMIMLLGMATKNAILLIDYTNVLRRRGIELFDAAKEAAKTRFRPVLMTTISTVLGMMPIALGFGAGGEARAPLGVAVAAGLLATTFLTLLVIPVVYTLFDQIQSGVVRLFSRQGAKA